LKIVESEQFREELREIAHLIKKDKPQASIKFVKNLKVAIKNLVHFPYKFRPSIYFDSVEIRDMMYHGYTVIYEIRNENKTLEILTIFNRNLPDIEEL
jgi:plasmid stabilization system protein ParE